MTQAVNIVARPPRAPARRAPLLAALALALSCGRCGAPAAKDAAELLPDECASALETAPLGALAQHGALAVQLASQLPGGEVVGENARALSAQLGVDLLSREGLLAAGLDPERGAAIAQLEAGAPGNTNGARASWIAALPLSSESTFAQKLESTLTERAGFSLRTDEPRGNVHCVVFARAGSGDKLAYAIVRGYGVVAQGSDPAGLVAGAAARPLAKSLAQAPQLGRARSDLDHPDVLLLSTSANPLLPGRMQRWLGGAQGERLGSALGLTLLPDGASLRLAQDLRDDQRARLAALFSSAPAADAFQTPQAPLELRVSANPAQLPVLLAQTPGLRDALANLRTAFQKNGADLDRDLFGALSPGAALALDLAPGANLGRALDPAALDLRARSPFDIVRLYAAAPARDPDGLRKAFAALAQALPLVGATAQRTAEKKPVAGGLLDEWTTRYDGGEGVRFGLFVPGRDLCGQSPPSRTQALVYALGGLGSLEDVLAARLPCARADGDARAAHAPAVSLQLDLGMLADELRQLPDSAYGSGPQVFVARSLVSQVIVPLQRLRVAAELKPSARGFVASVRLRIASEAPKDVKGAAP